MNRHFCLLSQTFNFLRHSSRWTVMFLMIQYKTDHTVYQSKKKKRYRCFRYEEILNIFRPVIRKKNKNVSFVHKRFLKNKIIFCNFVNNKLRIPQNTEGALKPKLY